MIWRAIFFYVMLGAVIYGGLQLGQTLDQNVRHAIEVYLDNFKEDIVR